MILYRANENLLYGDKRIPKGAIHPLSRLDERSIAILLQKERITMYRAPPLEQLPKFKYRTKRLKKFKLGTIELYGMTVDELYTITGLDKTLLKRWKADLCEDLGIKENVIGSG